jgi:Leu/Phe-tRNA-protein transferase
LERQYGRLMIIQEVEKGYFLLRDSLTGQLLHWRTNPARKVILPKNMHFDASYHVLSQLGEGEYLIRDLRRTTKNGRSK